MLKLYQILTRASEWLFIRLLDRRVAKGKEDPARLKERMGVTSKPRPDGPLLWLHAASVGEAQSALILIKAILEQHKALHILVTTGTLTSATLMEKSLPERVFHQFYPLDHPAWVEHFLDHWHPNLVLWMESELWPNMLIGIKQRKIPAALVNAKLSDRSFKRWRLMTGGARKILGAFSLVLTQTQKDTQRYGALGAHNVFYTDNIKHSAAALPADDQALKLLIAHTAQRPIWLFASTHDGEEDMAARIHARLKNTFADILTIIVPRHPERGEEIYASCDRAGLGTTLRGENHIMPGENTDIYIANTLGELGLFYRAAPIAVIGRSFSNDGGGGHNPIEAAQLNCAVLCGPNVQNLQEIYDDMLDAEAVIQCPDQPALYNQLSALLSDIDMLKTQQKRAINYAREKDKVLPRILQQLSPLLEDNL